MLRDSFDILCNFIYVVRVCVCLALCIYRYKRCDIMMFCVISSVWCVCVCLALCVYRYKWCDIVGLCVCSAYVLAYRCIQQTLAACGVLS